MTVTRKTGLAHAEATGMGHDAGGAMPHQMPRPPSDDSQGQGPSRRPLFPTAAARPTEGAEWRPGSGGAEALAQTTAFALRAGLPLRRHTARPRECWWIASLSTRLELWRQDRVVDLRHLVLSATAVILRSVLGTLCDSEQETLADILGLELVPSLPPVTPLGKEVGHDD